MRFVDDDLPVKVRKPKLVNRKSEIEDRWVEDEL